MNVKYLPDPESVEMLNTEELRDYFLLDDLFEKGKILLHYVEIDRAILGSVVPVDTDLQLTANKDTMAADYFCQRRELGIINIGASGTVEVDGKNFSLHNLDGLYIGRGSKSVVFRSDKPENPAQFYLLSYPSHASYPTKFIARNDTDKTTLGENESANKRIIEKYIHPEGVKSAQLVMGVTHIQPGSVWNTLPPHTHRRRTEIYFYFNIQNNQVVFHFCGEPNRTKHLVIRNKQAVISPSWSIHAGVGSHYYSFVWGMGGENQDFADMDWVAMEELR